MQTKYFNLENCQCKAVGVFPPALSVRLSCAPAASSHPASPQQESVAFPLPYPRSRRPYHLPFEKPAIHHCTLYPVFLYLSIEASRRHPECHISSPVPGSEYARSHEWSFVMENPQTDPNMSSRQDGFSGDNKLATNKAMASSVTDNPRAIKLEHNSYTVGWVCAKGADGCDSNAR